ncbi:MAG: cell division protein FtsQ, partial [Gammaproteobacteria bacterium]|nr:cell division protein FtsQ [Gammaproteobacteria bacterium]
ALLNGRGDVFVPHNPEVAGNLVRLHGPEGRAHEVLTQAHWFREQLAVEGLVLARVDLESRGAWRFWLDSGIEVALGRDHLEARFARFRKVYRTGLATQMDQVVRIDARYSNGVAVQWKDSLVPVQSAP